jgi:transcriptional regulator with GAF, ATPase, and Fis domain
MDDRISKKILEISCALAQEHDPEKLLKSILDSAIEFSGAEEGLILRLDSLDQFEIVAARNIDRLDSDLARFSQSIARQVMAGGRALYSQNAAGDAALSIFESVMVQNLKSVACTPLRSQNRITGVLYLASLHAASKINPDFLPDLETFAAHASVALHNAYTLQNKEVALQQAQAEIVSKDTEIATLTNQINQRPRTTLYSYESIIGRSKKMEDVFKILDKVSQAKVAVFIHGESGTGKELIAKALHQHSARSTNSFVAINCSAFTETMLESELFGYMKGSFTGAERDRAGLFESASGGTIFLDEIGDMSLSMQAKILRVIQEQEVLRVGARSPIKIDVRVVSASNRNLRAMAEQKLFREDLIYRLCGITINLPALRERQEDIPLLIKHFIDKITHENKIQNKIKVSRDALDALLHYTWPGNIRELEQTLTASILMADHGLIEKRDLLLFEKTLRRDTPATKNNSATSIPFDPSKSLSEYEKEIIIKTVID